MDARCDQKQQSLKTTKSESNNVMKSNNILSPTQENLATDRTTEQASENNDVTQASYQTLDDALTLADLEGHVTTVVAKVKYESTESQASRKIEHPGRRCTRKQHHQSTTRQWF